nr:PEP-CTERM-box response regulator transcription factor [Pleionea sp. CnH1-48]
MIVEDDPGLQSQLKWCFDDFEVLVAENRKNAISHLRRYEPAVVTLDLGLPPDPANASEGLAALQEILTLAPHTKVIVVTGNDDRDNALKAIALGAYDFYQKPVDPEILNLIVKRAYALAELERENRVLSKQVNESPLDGVIANSPAMIQVCRMVERVAPADVTTLLLGESGTGKEVLAKAVHELGQRSKNKLIAINCAAIPENLLESELFGYEKGAFTGAAKQTKGKIEYAHKGTLFLDEIGDLPMALQAKLLRFLQERTIERVGGREEIPVDVRVICATHRSLPEMVKDGSFREDLYYRLSEITIDIPPLAERGSDVILLAKAFLSRFNKELKRNIKGFSTDAIEAMENYRWPGNVRELENKVKRSVIMADDSQVTAMDLQLNFTESEDVMPLNLRQVREKAETEAILRAITISDGNISKAAEMLGLTRPTLYSLMSKYHIDHH